MMANEEIETAESIEKILEETALLADQVQKPPESTEPFTMDATQFASVVEAILFAAERPIGLDRIKEAFGSCVPDHKQLQEVIEIIQTRYQAQNRGFELRKAQGGYHFVTKVENAEYIRRFQASKPFRLGRSALEVMAIIAYRQPITRSEIDQVRGIDSSHLLRTLIERGLVRMAGKAEVPGRPVQYASTPKFLEMVGLASTSELPPLSELTELQGDIEDPQKKLEEGLERFMEPPPPSDVSATEAAFNEQDGAQDPLLGEIDSLIQTADHAPKEVFPSALHREIALANQEALEAFQAANRRRPRKQSITFDELTGGANSENGPIIPPSDTPN